VATHGGEAAFKIESHNHPSKIDPYTGSATGIGGLYRDVFTMGAEPRLAAALLRVGPIHIEEPEFTRSLVRGFTDYLTEFGVGEGAYAEYAVDASYSGNPLVNVFALGEILGPRLSARGGRAGDMLIYAGRPVDGAGYEAAAFASRVFASEGEAPTTSSSDTHIDAPPLVPPADPRMGRRVMDALLAAARRGWVIAVQDMGAGGIAGSAAELASRGPGGVILDLDHFPRQREFSPEVLLLSETQERVLIVAAPEHAEDLLAHFHDSHIPAAVVGQLVSTPTFSVRRGEIPLVEVPLAELTDVPPVVREDLVATAQAGAAERGSVSVGQGLLFSEESELLAQLGLRDDLSSVAQDLLLRYLASSRFPRRFGKQGRAEWTFDDVGLVSVGSDTSAVWGMSGAGEGNFFALDAYGAAQMSVFAVLRSLIARGSPPWVLRII